MKRRLTKRGSILVSVLVSGGLSLVVGMAYLELATSDLRRSRARINEMASANLAEAGLNFWSQALWRDFRLFQRFTPFEGSIYRSWGDLRRASPEDPVVLGTHTMQGIGNFTVSVMAYQRIDLFTRRITLRSVGWIDRNANGRLDDNEPRQVQDRVFDLRLGRSDVFDYAIFMNNFGYARGWTRDRLTINGDIRSNGDYTYENAVPTLNGSAIATANNLLDPPAQGILSFTGGTPVQWSNTQYETNRLSNQFARPAYLSNVHGGFGSDTFNMWRDYLYHEVGHMINQRPFGAVVADVNGTRRYDGTMLDNRPTEPITVPKLNDLSFYMELSQEWRDANGEGAYVEVWNPQRQRYERLSQNGVINGSVALVGTADRPIRIRGPVTVTQDVVIKGYVEGQGVLYAGRNVHVVGNIIYKNPPDFRGSNLEQLLNLNRQRDALGLMARGGVFVGNPREFESRGVLQYATPPHTRARRDEDGNWIPAYNARERDETGRMRYQSAYGRADQSDIASLCDSSINRIDAILYSDNVRAGYLGTNGQLVRINGSMVAKDGAMLFYAPLQINYDFRFRERSYDDTPLIDLVLARSAQFIHQGWMRVKR